MAAAANNGEYLNSYSRRYRRDGRDGRDVRYRRDGRDGRDGRYGDSYRDDSDGDSYRDGDSGRHNDPSWSWNLSSPNTSANTNNATKNATKNANNATNNIKSLMETGDPHKLFQIFLEIYLENILYSFEPSEQDSNYANKNKTKNNNNANKNKNKTKNNNNISKKVYDRFMEVIFNMAVKSDLESTDQILHTFFFEYYITIKNYYENIKPKINTVQNWYYLHCHGEMRKEISIVPENVVLIFLTPINRYGICDPSKSKNIMTLFQTPKKKLRHKQILYVSIK